MRILVAGFQHETNTFAPSKATYDNFLRGEGFPSLKRGDDVLSLRDINIPAGGFINEIQASGHELIPVLWAAACPSAHVTRDTYESIASEITNAALRLTPDAIYLDLHGAMVAEHLDDGEGELIERLRSIVGSDTPIVGSVDFHANVTERMLSLSDGLVGYRTYPHIDMAETGRATARLLTRLTNEPNSMHRAFRRIPFLIPLNGMCTLLEPAKAVFQDLRRIGNEVKIFSCSFTPGFPAADFDECGPVVWAYATDQLTAEGVVDQLYLTIVAQERNWAVQLLSPDDAVKQAIEVAASSEKPVLIADTQDNPHGGGDSNTTGMLRALVRNGAINAALGLICDPSAAIRSAKAGVGNVVRLSLGGTSGVQGDSPFEGDFVVEAICDGRCVLGGPMMRGTEINVGLTVCLRIGGVRTIVSSEKAPMNDRNLYRMAGIEPESMSILVNKSSVHFRADFGPITETVLIAKAPGPVAADPSELPWKRLRPGMRLKPGGPPFVRPN